MSASSTPGPRRISRRHLLAGLLAVPLLPACSAQGATPIPPTRAPGPSPTPPPHGGRATLGFVGDLTTLNPLLARSPLVTTLMRPSIEGLFSFDPDGQPRAWLAERVPVPEGGGISDDGRVVIIRLRQGVAWDDGWPLTAHDLIFTRQAGLDPGNPLPPELVDAYRAIRYLDLLDSFTVRLAYDEPTDSYLRLFAPLFPAHLFNERTRLVDHPYNRNPVGTGPFRFKEWLPGDHLTLTRNPSYRLGGLPYLDELLFRQFPDRAAADAALAASEIDLLLADDGGQIVAASPRAPVRGIVQMAGQPPTWDVYEWWRAAR